MNTGAFCTSFALATAAGAVGCRTSAPTPTFPRPLDESRALSIIVDAYREGGQVASGGRDLLLSSGRTLRVDVGTTGHQYGVAYVTKADADELDSSRDLPPPMGADDLPLVQGSGPDSDAVVLVLLAARYVVHAPDGVLAIDDERRLRRDVRDFLLQARAHNLP